MSSNNKQQKRAKRAAAKAKQNRVARNRSTLTLPSIDEFFMSTTERGLNDELFEEMADAEETSLSYMMEVFLDDELLSMVAQNYSARDMQHYVDGVLSTYRMVSAGATPDEAIAWARGEEVLEAYLTAVQIKMAVAGMDDTEE